MKKNIYTFAKLGEFDSFGLRYGGAGLGNILFPWARSLVFAQKNQLKRINSTWPTIKLGPLLRGELDNRFYWDLFKDDENISGLKKFYLLNTSKNISENEKEDVLDSSSNENKIILFEGMEGLFKPIVNDSELVRDELLKIILNKHKEKFLNHEKKSINVHIRMGDFTEPPSEEFLRQGHWNYRLPLKWYISMINKLRENLKYDILVNVFSDGKDEDLAEILNINNVKRCSYDTAISDMFGLSKGSVLIASASTFSMWGSYLGQIPTIWYPGVFRHALFDNKNIYEGEIDYDDKLPDLLLENIKGLIINEE